MGFFAKDPKGHSLIGTAGGKYNHVTTSGLKAKEKFWIKVQSNGIETPLLIYNKTKTCFFMLPPGKRGHRKLVDKVSKDTTFLGEKSYFRAKFNDNKICTVLSQTSSAFQW